MNHYETLGLPTTATDSDIKKAYRKLALKLHPDKNKSVEAEEEFKKVIEAYNILSDSSKKALYDRTLNGAAGGAASSRPTNGFGNYSNYGNFGGWSQQPFNDDIFNHFTSTHTYTRNGNTHTYTFGNDTNGFFNGRGRTAREHFENSRRQHEEAKRRKDEDEVKRREKKKRDEEARDNARRQAEELKRRSDERMRKQREARAREAELAKRRAEEIEKEARKKLADLRMEMEKTKSTTSSNPAVKPTAESITTDSVEQERQAQAQAQAQKHAEEDQNGTSEEPVNANANLFESDNIDVDNNLETTYQSNNTASTTDSNSTPRFKFEPEESSAGGYKYDPDETNNKSTWEDAGGFQPQSESIDVDPELQFGANPDIVDSDGIVEERQTGDTSEPIEVEVISSGESGDEDEDASEDTSEDASEDDSGDDNEDTQDHKQFSDEEQTMDRDDVELGMNDSGGTKEDPIVIDLEDSLLGEEGEEGEAGEGKGGDGMEYDKDGESLQGTQETNGGDGDYEASYVVESNDEEAMNLKRSSRGSSRRDPTSPKKQKTNSYKFRDDNENAHHDFFQSLKEDRESGHQHVDAVSGPPSPDKRKSSYNSRGEYRSDKRHHKKVKTAPPTKLYPHPIVQQEETLFATVCSHDFNYTGRSFEEILECKRQWEDMFLQYERLYQQVSALGVSVFQRSGDSALLQRTLGHSALIADKRREFAQKTLALLAS